MICLLYMCYDESTISRVNHRHERRLNLGITVVPLTAGPYDDLSREAPDINTIGFPCVDLSGASSPLSFNIFTTKFETGSNTDPIFPIDGNWELNTLGFLTQIWGELAATAAPIFNTTATDLDGYGSIFIGGTIA